MFNTIPVVPLVQLQKDCVHHLQTIGIVHTKQNRESPCLNSYVADTDNRTVFTIVKLFSTLNIGGVLIHL
jgi:hypothetical protein